MSPLSEVSRRSLVAMTALAAMAPAAQAEKKRKKTRRKHKKAESPLAFVLATLTDVAVDGPVSDLKFKCNFEWALVYPAGPHALTSNNNSVEVAATTQSQLRAAIVSTVRNRAFNELDFEGFDVPADRISVALI